ncbi:MAG: hypothetical protein RL338_915 [Chloroflexota bacterium]
MTRPDPAEVARFAAARDRVLDRIGAAARLAGRDPGEVTLVAVSKTVPAERLAAAVAAGLTLLGENRVQEAAEKAPLLPGVTWQLVGPLQSNKARRALETFSLIQTVDSVELARRLDRISGELAIASFPVLVQVNVDLDPAKAGFAPGELARVLDELAGLERLRLDGLMTIGRLTSSEAEARATFRGLREVAAALRGSGSRGGFGGVLGPALSMGMSDDYPLAIEEGATIVRVGRALFGDRPAA